MKKIRLGILGSTRGTDMLAIINAIKEKKLPATINVVLSNKENAGILSLAKEHNLNHIFINPQDLTRQQYDENVSLFLELHKVNLVLLIGYMRILTSEFINKWRGKVLNVHPSLLPAFSGGMDQNVHQAVLDAKIKETGCTVHYVTEEIDSGPIIIQKSCHVFPDDSVTTLKQRVQQLEGAALIEAILEHQRRN